MRMIMLSPEIKKELELTSARMNTDKIDYLIIPRKLNCQECLIDFPASCVINSDDVYDVTFTISSINYNLKIESVEFTDNGEFKTAFCKFLSPLPYSFSDKIKKIMNTNEEINQRQEERIICTKDNLEFLGLIPQIKICFNGFNYSSYIKDISFSGINILTNEKLISENGEFFIIYIVFINPDMKCIFKTKVIRKKVLTLDGKNYAQLAFMLEQNVKYKKRLAVFFERQHAVSRSAVR